MNESIYERYFDEVFRNRLLFGTKEEYGEYFDSKSMLSNSLAKIEDRMGKFLKVEADLSKAFCDIPFDLALYVDYYAYASQFYKKCGRHKAYDASNRAAFMEEVLDYFVGDEEKNVGRTYKFKKDIDEIEAYDVHPLFLLLLIGRFVPVCGNCGDEDYDVIKQNYDDMLTFFVTSDDRINKDLDFVDHRSREAMAKIFVKVDHKEHPDIMKDRCVNRILIMHVALVLYQQLQSSKNKNAIYESVEQNEYLLPQIDGLWCEKEDDNEPNTFWQIIALSDNSYKFTHYEKIVKASKPVYKFENYEVYFVKQGEKTLCTMLSESVLTSLIEKGAMSKDERSMFYARFDDQDAPTKIIAENKTRVNNRVLRGLYKMADNNEQHQQLREAQEKGWCEAKHPEWQSTVYLALFCISYDNIFLKDGHGVIYRIPRSLNRAFDDVTLSSNMGILEMNGKRYVSLGNSLLYIDITTPEIAEKNGIQIVKDITADII